jgi:hypothetical protein
MYWSLTTVSKQITLEVEMLDRAAFVRDRACKMKWHRTYHKGSVGSLPGEETSTLAAHAM